MDQRLSSMITPDDAEDSAFYAELTRQILLLTDEDEDDDKPQVRNKYVRRFNHRLVGGTGLSANYFSWSESSEVSVPGWMERLWAAKGGGGGGTGVFIPRGGVVRSRRRHNKAKKNTERSRVHPAAAGHKNLGSS